MSTLMLITNDVYLLINYVTFVESLSFAVSIAALFYFRIKRPNMHRPIKVGVTVIVCLPANIARCSRII